MELRKSLTDDVDVNCPTVDIAAYGLKWDDHGHVAMVLADVRRRIVTSLTSSM